MQPFSTDLITTRFARELSVTTDWEAFALMMDLAMMGCGTNAILETEQIGKLAVIINKLTVANRM